MQTLKVGVGKITPKLRRALFTTGRPLNIGQRERETQRNVASYGFDGVVPLAVGGEHDLARFGACDKLEHSQSIGGNAKGLGSGSPPITARRVKRQNFRQQHRDIRLVQRTSDVEQIADMPSTIMGLVRDGDVVITMGAGSISGVPAKLTSYTGA